MPHIHWAEAAHHRINSLFGLVGEGFKTRMTAIKPIWNIYKHFVEKLKDFRKWILSQINKSARSEGSTHVPKEDFLDKCEQNVLEDFNFVGWGEAGIVLHFILLREPAMQVSQGLYPLMQKHIYMGNKWSSMFELFGSRSRKRFSERMGITQLQLPGS